MDLSSSCQPHSGLHLIPSWYCRSCWTSGTPAEASHRNIETDWAQMSTQLMSLWGAWQMCHMLPVFLQPFLPSPPTWNLSRSLTDKDPWLGISSFPHVNSSFPMSWLTGFMPEINLIDIRHTMGAAGVLWLYPAPHTSTPSTPGLWITAGGGGDRRVQFYCPHQTTMPRGHFDFETLKETNEFVHDC